MEIPDYFVQMWMKEECSINDVLFNYVSGFQLVLPRNPLRFAIIWARSTTNNASVIFSEQPPQSGWQQIALPTQDATYSITYDQFGDAMRLPMYFFNAAAANNLLFLEMSFIPWKYDIYRRFMNEFVSKFNAPRQP